MDQSSGERIIDTAPPSAECAPHAAAANGTGAHHADPPREAAGADSEHGNDPRLARAEQIVDHLAERVAGFTSTWGRRVLWLGTRVKEEAEDMWAEAQSIRRGDQK
jgi:hypothetical protein